MTGTRVPVIEAGTGGIPDDIVPVVFTHGANSEQKPYRLVPKRESNSTPQDDSATLLVLLCGCIVELE